MHSLRNLLFDIVLLRSLKHLDLRRVSEEEKSLARASLTKMRPAPEPPSFPTSSQQVSDDVGKQGLQNVNLIRQQQENPREQPSSGVSANNEYDDNAPIGMIVTDSGHGVSSTSQHNGGTSVTKDGFGAPDIQQKEGSPSHDQFFPPAGTEFKSTLPQNAFDLEVLSILVCLISYTQCSSRISFDD